MTNIRAKTVAYNYMKFSKIDSKNFNLKPIQSDLSFRFGENQYRILLSEPEEIRMSFYIRDIKIYKNGQLYKSREKTLDCHEYELTSKNFQYIGTPTENGFEIINLKSKDSKEFEVYFMIGNIFSIDNKYCIVNGHLESILIELETLTIKMKIKNRENHLSKARFDKGNNILLFDFYGQKLRLEKIDTETLISSYQIIESPFELNNIEYEKYAEIINSNTHNLGLKSGGMGYSKLLDTWNYVNSENKIVYKTLLPTTKIKFSKGYNRNYCEVEEVFYELSGDNLNFEKPMNDFWNKIKSSLKL